MRTTSATSRFPRARAAMALAFAMATTAAATAAPPAKTEATLEPLRYNQPGLVVDLGVGLE
jgi:hypothetical protein